MFAVPDGNMVSNPGMPTVPGYTFNFWKLDNQQFDFRTPITQDVDIEASLTLDASFIELEFVECINGEVTDNSLLKTTVEIDPETGDWSYAVDESLRERFGYTYKGILVQGTDTLTTADVLDNSVLGTTLTGGNRYKLNVYYQAVTVILVLHRDSGSTVEYNVRYGSRVELPTDAKDGEEFQGWMVNGYLVTGDDAVLEKVEYVDTVHLYPRFMPDWITVHLNANGAAVADKAAKYGRLLDVEDIFPTQTHYRFDGWWTTEESGGIQVIDANGKGILNVSRALQLANWSEDGSVTLYARFVQIEYPLTVNFDSHGTSVILEPDDPDDSLTITTSGTVVWPRIGWVYSVAYTAANGWHGKSTNPTSVYYNTTTAQTLTLVSEGNVYHADFYDEAGTTKLYTVYWRIGDSKFYSNSACTTQITKLPDSCMTKSGMDFQGYYTAANGGGTQLVNTDGTFKSALNQIGNRTKLWPYFSAADQTITFRAVKGTGMNNTGIDKMYYRKGTSGSWTEYTGPFTAAYNSTVQGYATCASGSGYASLTSSSSPTTITVPEGGTTVDFSAKLITYEMSYNNYFNVVEWASKSGSLKLYDLSGNEVAGSVVVTASPSNPSVATVTVTNNSGVYATTGYAKSAADYSSGKYWCRWKENRYSLRVKATCSGSGTAWTSGSSSVYLSFYDSTGAYISSEDAGHAVSNAVSSFNWTVSASDARVSAQYFGIRFCLNGNGTITFNVQVVPDEAGDVASMATQSATRQIFNIESGTYNLPTVTREGYTFNGWKSSTTETIISAGTAVKPRNEYCWPTWTINKYKLVLSKQTGVNTMQYSIDGGSTWTTYNAGTTGVDINYGKTVHVKATANAGYTAGQASSTNIGTMGTSGLTYTCTATANNYTLTLNRNSGSGGTAAVYYKYNTATYYSDSSHATAITSIAVPTRTGYTFGGYYTNSDGTGTCYITSAGAFTNNPHTLTANTTLYAKWTINKYTVTLSQGTGAGTIKYKYGSQTSYSTYSAALTNIEYGTQFSVYTEAVTGYTQTNPSGTPMTFTVGAGNVTKTLSATANTYYMSLNMQSGTGGTSTVYYKYNTNKYYSDSACTTQITAITKPTYSNGSLQGFYTSTSGGGTQLINSSGGFVNNPYTYAGNRTVYAYWKFGVQINLGTNLTGATYQIGTGSWTAITASTKVWANSGTTVKAYGTSVSSTAWKVGQNSSNPISVTAGTTLQTINLTAVANTTTITFSNANGSNGTTTATKTIGAQYGTLPDPGTRRNYTFSGWYNGTTKLTTTTTVSTSITTWTAQWTEVMILDKKNVLSNGTVCMDAMASASSLDAAAVYVRYNNTWKSLHDIAHSVLNAYANTHIVGPSTAKVTYVHAFGAVSSTFECHRYNTAETNVGSGSSSIASGTIPILIGSTNSSASVLCNTYGTYNLNSGAVNLCTSSTYEHGGSITLPAGAVRHEYAKTDSCPLGNAADQTLIYTASSSARQTEALKWYNYGRIILNGVTLGGHAFTVSSDSVYSISGPSSEFGISGYFDGGSVEYKYIIFDEINRTYAYYDAANDAIFGGNMSLT